MYYMEHITEGMAGEQESLIIPEEQAGQRADVGLAALLDITRSNMQKLLNDGRAVKGSKVLKANYKLRARDEIVVTLPGQHCHCYHLRRAGQGLRWRGYFLGC